MNGLDELSCLARANATPLLAVTVTHVTSQELKSWTSISC